MKGSKSILYMALALGMVIYAVPQLEMGGGWSMPTVFAVVWVAFAILIVASHLHELLGVDAETRRELDRIHHLKRWQLEQKLTGSTIKLGRK